MTFKPAMRCIAILALLMTLTATSAHADFMTYNGLTLSRSVTVHDTTLGTIRTRAGQFSVTYKGVDRWAYCTELTQTAGSMNATELPINTLPNYQFIAYLMEQVAPAGGNALAAQIAVAIWEAVYETSGTLDLTAGSMYIDEAGIAAGANGLISSFPGSYTPTEAFRLVNPKRQDMLIVPEPVTMSLMGIGGAGVLLKRRRK